MILNIQFRDISTYILLCNHHNDPFSSTFSSLKHYPRLTITPHSPLPLASDSHYSTLSLYEFDDGFLNSCPKSLFKPIENTNIYVSIGITSFKMTLT